MTRSPKISSWGFRPRKEAPLRIGLILEELGGGAAKNLFQLADSFLKRGHRVDLILLRPTGSYFKTIPTGLRLYFATYPFYLRDVPGGPAFLADAARHGLVFDWLPVSPWKRLLVSHALRRHWPEIRIPKRLAVYCASVAAYIRQNQPDVLFSALHEANVAAVGGKVLANAETPIAVSIRDQMAASYSRSFVLTRARVLYKEASAIIAVSNSLAAEVAETLSLAKNQIASIYNFFPIAKIVALAAEPIEHPWFAERAPPVVLTVGRPVPQKDHPTLIRAFALLRRSMEVRLVILCGVSQHENQSALGETKELASSLGVAEDVAYLDFDENPFRYMSRAAVMALSSRHEGFGNVLVETMACGTPVASTDAPYGPAEILEGGRWGPLVPVGDADALAEALAGILAGQRVSAEDLRARAAAFSEEKGMEVYEAFLTKLLL